MRRALLAVVFLLTVSILAPGLSSAAEETIGIVKNSTGAATITRGDQVLPVVAGTKLIAGDILGTGPDGSMGVLLRDNSSLAIGPGSRLVIRNFLFSPSEGKLDLLVRVTKGTMAYVSGLIGKLAPESARFETPVASIGTRGTRFAVKVNE